MTLIEENQKKFGRPPLGGARSRHPPSVQRSPGGGRSVGVAEARLRPLTCAAGPLAEGVEGGFGPAGPAGAGGERLSQLLRAQLLGVVGGRFAPVCNTAAANQQPVLMGPARNRGPDLEAPRHRIRPNRNRLEFCWNS